MYISIYKSISNAVHIKDVNIIYISIYIYIYIYNEVLYIKDVHIIQLTTITINARGKRLNNYYLFVRTNKYIYIYRQL